MKSTSDIRKSFLGFFESKGHTVMPSAPLIPHNDPTLLFTNAGMVPFKHVFSGAETLRDKRSKAVHRAVSTQKCIRAGGKHNDLDNVGYTARHHTFFEMLGNFSFGDYFKEGAVSYAWEFITKELGLPRDKLYFTVYHTDDEAYNLWKKIAGAEEGRILRVPTKDNFWAMGPTGPCGPCSEVFYDHGEKAGKGKWALDKKGNDLFGSRFVEIWNLVFMQFEQLEPEEQEGEAGLVSLASPERAEAPRHGEDSSPSRAQKNKRINLPKPCIDTGMGLERVAAVMQGVHDNYDTDLFRHLIRASQEVTKNQDPRMMTSHRVIADHLRSCSFLLAEGVRPSNEGRGYVLRRIMRRAMRHAHMLGAKKPVMHRLVPYLAERMGGYFHELHEQQAVIEHELEAEETRFKETLGRGLKLLEEEAAGLKQGDALRGSVAFRLYDTFGFPLDLTQDILRARDISVDTATFEAEMAQQKKRARAAWSGSGDAGVADVWFELFDAFGITEFLGYETLEATGTVIALMKDGEKIGKAQAGEEILLLTNQTPFYGESGGQAGDRGYITSHDGLKVRVEDTLKPTGKLIVHKGVVESGAVSVGDEVQLHVDGERRAGLRRNHSATHLLHAALREVLGAHVTQKGSLVEQEYLRFDFSNDKAVGEDEQRMITETVNAVIRQNAPVTTELMTPDEAKAKGAMALFGEKYGDEVRVLSMGRRVSGFRIQDSGKESREKSAESTDLGARSPLSALRSLPFSIELCGGTHVERTGDIGYFRITKESSVSSGVRRIEAITGPEAVALSLKEHEQLVEAAAQLKTTPQELGERIATLQQEQKKLEKELRETKQKLALGGGGTSGGSDSTETIGSVTFLGKVLEGVAAKDLRGLMDQYKQQIKSGVIALIALDDGKAGIVVGVTADLVAKYSAVDLVRLGSEALGGKGGGGRPDFAQAGGTAENPQAAIEAIKGALG